MNRRKFLLASGSTILTGTAIGSLQRPAVGIDFELSSSPDKKPAKASSILIEFTNFEITPMYLDESSGLDITVELDIEGEPLVSKAVSGLSFTNGRTIDKAEVQSKTGKDLSSVVIDEIDKSGSNLSGDVYVKLNHPDISEKKYKQSFDISKKSITDDFDDGSLNTSKWSFIGGSNGASFTESSDQIELISNSKARPYLRTDSGVVDAESGGSVNVKSRSKINNNGIWGQIKIHGWWDGNYDGRFDAPVNAVGLYVEDNDSVAEIRIVEGGSIRSPDSTSVSGLNSYSDWEIDIRGNFSDFDVTAYKDGTQILSKSNLTFTPTNNSPYVAVYARETESTSSFDNINVSI